MGETKSMYITAYGIAPYLKSLVQKHVKEESDYVLLFDESLNTHLQMKQMDLLVRCWDSGKLSSRYFKSVFMGHSTALDMKAIMHEHVEDSFGFSNLLQLSMDGPNVNWALFHQLREDITKEYNKELIDIGSCSLHTLHNCFRHGAQVTGWDIGSVLSSSHILFKDVPARRDDYIQVTNSDIFPLSFCHHRWVENIAVARRAMEIRSNVETFINSARDKVIK